MANWHNTVYACNGSTINKQLVTAIAAHEAASLVSLPALFVACHSTQRTTDRLLIAAHRRQALTKMLTALDALHLATTTS